MKELIYKFPIIEAFKKDDECPFCVMKNQIEKDKIEFVIGSSSSYMESNIREETDKYGFCSNHLEKLYIEKNRLGLALILSTHLKNLNCKLSDIFQVSKINQKKSLFKKNENNKLNIFLNEYEKSCYLCMLIDKTFLSYINNYFHLYKKNIDVIDLTKNSKGFCIPHFNTLIEESKKHLNNEQIESFLKIIIPIQLDNLKRIENETLWFIDKFDYRNNDASWKNSKDAIPRLIKKLKGKINND